MLQHLSHHVWDDVIFDKTLCPIFAHWVQQCLTVQSHVVIKLQSVPTVLERPVWMFTHDQSSENLFDPANVLAQCCMHDFFYCCCCTKIKHERLTLDCFSINELETMTKFSLLLTRRTVRYIHLAVVVTLLGHLWECFVSFSLTFYCGELVNGRQRCSGLMR